MPLQSGSGLLIFSAFNTVLAYGAFAEALDHWKASRVSAVLSLTPMITLATVFSGATLFPMLLSADRMTWLGWMGAAWVMLGSAWVASGKRPEPTPPSAATKTLKS